MKLQQTKETPLIICECQNALATHANGLCDACNRAEEEQARRKAQVLEEQKAWEERHKHADGFDYVDGKLWRVRYDSPMFKYEMWEIKKGTM